MTDDILKALENYPNIMKMLDGIPRDLWHLLLPEDKDELMVLEGAIIAFRLREKEREKVMSIQRVCNFPLRPNALLNEVTARARIQGLKNNDRLKRRRNNGRRGKK